ncbi:AarF/ABC1/UbiB kinase family protein [Psychrobacter arenosus]|uniref:ABC1 kinase family protein n=1 Tax=Psychrobacter arenosus TaxID=256326 RepID=UPI00191B2F74|nr:AarF/ABC1/UbiB kinase family protein [Psychrobacter arenosus]
MADNSNSTLDELKTSRLDRRLSIAKTSLQLGKRWAGNSVSGLFLNKEDRRTRNQAFMQEQAKYLADELGKLKGSVVKIGQMLALYGEHFLPPEITEALQSLNDNTATLSWTSMQKTLKAQLGDLYAELEIDPVPIGTASLAQVHKAIIRETGQLVVLKVQYPGVADAIDSDLSLFKHLLRVTKAVPQTRIFDEWFAEIQDLLHQEVDYLAEAATTERFYDRLKDDNRYVVPQIIRRYSSERLLCMTFEHGVSITDPSLRQLSQSRRNTLGQAAIEIMLQEIFVWGEMQTDPNFGNYLIRINNPEDTATDLTADSEVPDQVVLLDFGAIRQFDDHLLRIARGLLEAGFYHDFDAMLASMHGYEFLDTMSQSVREDMARVFLTATEPFSLPELNPDIPPALIDSDGLYSWAESRLHQRIMKEAGSAMQSTEFSLPPKELMFISRKFIGAYTFLTVLDAHTESRPLIAAVL